MAESLMAPEPIRRISPYRIFEKMEIRAGVRKFLAVVDRLYFSEREIVISSFCGLNVEIYVSAFESVTNHLSSGNVISLNSQEIRPIIGMMTCGPLIAYETGHKTLVSLKFYKPALCACHRYGFRSEPRSNLQHKPIEHLIAKRMIDLHH